LDATDDQEEIYIPFCDCAVTAVQPLLLMLVKAKLSDKRIKSVDFERSLLGRKEISNEVGRDVTVGAKN
jgi:hypothetical protein